MSKRKMNFQSLDALGPIVAVVNEAAEAVKDPKRTIINSAIPEVLAGVAGAAIGGAASFTALWAIGTTAASMFSLSGAGIMGGLAAAGLGAGAVAGIFVLAAPVAILAGTGVGIAAALKKKRLKQEKDQLYQEAMKKHNPDFSAILASSFLLTKPIWFNEKEESIFETKKKLDKDKKLIKIMDE